MRNCPNCARLRAEIEELKADLAAWDSYENDQPDLAPMRISAWLGLQSRTSVIVLTKLLSKSGAVVAHDILANAMEYEGDNMKGHIRTLVSLLNKGLREKGLPEIENNWGHGYTISKSNAAAITKALETVR